MGFPSFTGLVVTALRIIGSTVVGKHSAVLVGGEGQVGALDPDSDADQPGERVEDAEAYGAPGIVFRPRPPETIEGEEIAAEAMALKLGGIDTPIAWRDLRLNRKFPAPKPGTVALVGYGGGFLSFDDTDSLENRSTWYVPYAGGTKAMAVAIDPVDETLTITHGDGYQIAMTPTGLTMRTIDDATFFKMEPGKISLQAEKILLKGNCYVGAQAEAGWPLLAGSASPPCPSLFVSPV